MSTDELAAALLEVCKELKINPTKKLIACFVQILKSLAESSDG